jgi:APA family basic amino acid/polyamine antiporter
MPGSTGTPPAVEPRRHLGVLDAAAIFGGIVLGSGIFVAPAAVAAAAPGAAGAAALWAAGALAAACGAFCYAECASRMPRDGGFFVFYREAYGEPLAFVAAWAAVFVTYPASVAAISRIGAGYVVSLTGWPLPEAALAATGLAAAAVLNAWGVRAGPRAQRVLTTGKAGALAMLCVAAALAGAGPSSAAAGGAAPASMGWAGAFAVVLFTYDGWSDVTLVAGEIRDPMRDLARAVLLALGALAVLYAVVQVCVLALLTPERAAASTRVVSEAVEAGLGAGWGDAVSAVVAVCTFGSATAIVLVVSRLAWAMGGQGALPRAFAVIHPGRGTPVRATWGVAAVSAVYAAFAGFQSLVEYFTFTVWIFYSLTAAAVLILRRRRVGEGTAWRAPGGVAAPAVVVAVGAVMTGGLFLRSPLRSSLGLLLLACGFGVWALRRRALRRRGTIAPPR